MAMTLKHTKNLQERPPVIGQERGLENEWFKLADNMSNIEENMMSKPPVPPKPSNLEDSVMHQFQSPKLSDRLQPVVESSPPHTTGSETSRSFHPEGN